MSPTTIEPNNPSLNLEILSKRLETMEQALEQVLIQISQDVSSLAGKVKRLEAPVTKVSGGRKDAPNLPPHYVTTATVAKLTLLGHSTISRWCRAMDTKQKHWGWKSGKMYVDTSSFLKLASTQTKFRHIRATALRALKYYQATQK